MTRERLASICDQGIRFSYYALIFFLPISIAFCEIFSGIIIFLFLTKRISIFLEQWKDICQKQKEFFGRVRHAAGLIPKIFKPVDNYLNTPVALFILVCALSIVQSENISVSLSGFFFKVLEWTYLYFIFVEFIKTRKQLEIFTVVFLSAAVFISVNGLVQKISGHDFIFGEIINSGRVNSSFRHANDFGGYLTLVCPFLLALFMSYNFSAKKSGNMQSIGNFFKNPVFTMVLLPAVCILAVICLGWTLSRGAWVGFFIALLFFGLIKKRFFFFSCLIVIMFYAVFSPSLSQVRQASLFGDYIDEVETQRQQKLNEENRKNYKLGKFSELMKFLKDFSGSGRGAYWQEAIAVIKKAPILGFGVNTYSLVAPHFKLSWGGYPHNCYLQMAAEIGLLGLLSFLWIIISLTRGSLRKLKSMKDDNLSFIMVGSLAGLVAFWIHSFFDTNFYSVQLGNLMWVVMGLVVASQRVFEEEKGKQDA